MSSPALCLLASLVAAGPQPSDSSPDIHLDQREAARHRQGLREAAGDREALPHLLFLMRAASKTGSTTKAQRHLNKLHEAVSDGSDWARDDAAGLEVAREAVAMASKDVGTEHHRAFQNNKRVADARLAVAAYQGALQLAGPDWEERLKFTFYLAELHWDLGEWANAAARYRAVYEVDPGHRYAEDAAYNAVLAYRKIENGAPPSCVKGGKVKGCNRRARKRRTPPTVQQARERLGAVRATLGETGVSTEGMEDQTRFALLFDAALLGLVLDDEAVATTYAKAALDASPHDRTETFLRLVERAAAQAPKAAVAPAWAQGATTCPDRTPPVAQALRRLARRGPTADATTAQKGRALLCPDG